MFSIPKYFLSINNIADYILIAYSNMLMLDAFKFDYYPGCATLQAATGQPAPPEHLQRLKRQSEAGER
jgi:hypothetical protein